VAYRIVGKSKFGFEELDTAEDITEAMHLIAEYEMAFGGGWSTTLEEV